MSTAATLTSIVASVVVVLAAVGALVRLIWKAGELVSAVRDNTTATSQLAEEFRTYRAEVAAQLAGHDARIIALEHSRA